MRTSWLIVVLVLTSRSALAQFPPEHQPDLPIDAATPERIVAAVADNVRDSYVFRDKGTEIAAAIRAHLHHGEYSDVHTAQALIDRIMPELREASHDRHLRLLYSYESLNAPKKDGDAPSPRSAEDASDNYGFARVQRLDGNIGYIDLRFFASPADAGSLVVASMALVAHTRALIFDLRDNHGGYAEMVALMLSYFFGPDPVHLNDIYWRPDDSTGQSWTQPYVVGTRYTGDVYVLTSSNTFSAAEEFAYDLQSQKRATIVGETTAGGAHPISIHQIGDHFVVLVPSGRSINPVTHTDWEGTGVKPDVAVPAARALKTAQLAALEKLHADTAVIAATRKELEAIAP